MPNAPTDTQAIGVTVAITLVDGTAVKGTIFTYMPKEEVLVLLHGFSDGSPNVKIIRTCFIKDVTVVSDAEAEKLPPSLDQRAQLPPMQHGRNVSLLKQITSQLRVARAKRTDLLRTEDKNTPIAAFDTLSKLDRIYPGLRWDAEEGVIRVTQEVFVKGSPDWNTPVAVAIDGAGDNGANLVERIQKVLSKK